jgi:hypothetical protein
MRRAGYQKKAFACGWALAFGRVEGTFHALYGTAEIRALI